MEDSGPGADAGYRGAGDARTDLEPVTGDAGQAGRDRSHSGGDLRTTDVPPVDPSLCPPENVVAPGCVSETNEGEAGLCDGLDNDCDGTLDEGCACTPGQVQPCFGGPPGRRHVGACADGTQRCTMAGESGGVWGECEGSQEPRGEKCDSLDNNCNGCVDEIENCSPTGACPGPGDPRVPSGSPFHDYILRGEDFFDGPASAWRWEIVGGPCDRFPLAVTSFDLRDADQATAVFTPRLSGDYIVHLTVESPGGTFNCTWVVHVAGPGLRIELCYPEAHTQDLDLILKQPGVTSSWYAPGGSAQDPPIDACSWANCKATLHEFASTRADWGYEPSELAQCIGGPQGQQWQTLGFCANPRLDIDNNIWEGTGLPENINIDAPRDGEVFRIMVQNFSGTLAHPVVTVYCDGHRVATYGMAPDDLINFEGGDGYVTIGAMWRVADVTTHVDAEGEVTCDVEMLRSSVDPLPNGQPYDVTYDDPRY